MIKERVFPSSCIHESPPGPPLPKERELLRRWTVYLVVCGFLAGLALCLITDLYDTHHGPATTFRVTYSVEFCEAFVVSCEDESDSHRLLLVSSLAPERNTFYEGVSFPPPFPPPRG